mmetsp:Transcript_41349/g.102927  ORF Transcript_41349/g.102927 Transcript_41349/m.102927 type:complete len:322 (-) Transcript_41349:444-1409(-)
MTLDHLHDHELRARNLLGRVELIAVRDATAARLDLNGLVRHAQRILHEMQQRKVFGIASKGVKDCVTNLEEPKGRQGHNQEADERHEKREHNVLIGRKLEAFHDGIAQHVEGGQGRDEVCIDERQDLVTVRKELLDVIADVSHLRLQPSVDWRADAGAFAVHLLANELQRPHFVHVACTCAVVVKPNTVQCVELLLPNVGNGSQQAMLLAQRKEEVGLVQVICEAAVRGRVHQVEVAPESMRLGRVRERGTRQEARVDDVVHDVLNIIKLRVVARVAVAHKEDDHEGHKLVAALEVDRCFLGVPAVSEACDGRGDGERGED